MPSELLTLEECANYLEQVGLATVLPSKAGLLPCLLWKVQGFEGPISGDEPGFFRTWRWKDELPGQGLAWAGRWLGHQVILMHRRLLPIALGARGRLEPADLYADGLLSRPGWQLFSLLSQQKEARGRKWLRQQLGWGDKAGAPVFDKACLELERRLLITRAGSSPQAQGWDSNAYRCLSTHFPNLEPLPHREALAQLEKALQEAAPKASPTQIKRWLKAL